MSDPGAAQGHLVQAEAPRTATTSFVDEDLIDYDSDDLLVIEPNPAPTTKLSEAQVQDDDKDIADAALAESYKLESIGDAGEAHSPSFDIDVGNNESDPQHLQEDVDNVGEQSGDAAQTSAADHGSYHEIDYEHDDFDYEAVPDGNNPTGNPADATASMPQQQEDKGPRKKYEIDWEDDESQEETGADVNDQQRSPHDVEDDIENKTPDAKESAAAVDSPQSHAAQAQGFPEIWVQYKGQDYPFFSTGGDGFSSNKDILYRPMRVVLGELRAELADEIERDEELVFQVDKLGLEFSESSPSEALDIQFSHVCTTLEILVNNQRGEPGDSPTVFAYLFTRPNTINRFNTLQDALNAGRGLRDVIYTFQPPSAGHAENIGQDSGDDQGQPRGCDDADVEEVKQEHGDALGYDEDYVDDPETVEDGLGIDYVEADNAADDEFAHDGAEVVGENAAPSPGGPIEDVVDAVYEDELEPEASTAAQDEDLIDFTAGGHGIEPDNLDAAAHTGVDADPGFVSGKDTFEDDLLADYGGGGERAHTDGPGRSDTGKSEVKNALTTRRQYDDDDDLIDYTDDKLEVAPSTSLQFFERKQGVSSGTAAYDSKFDNDLDAFDLADGAELPIGNSIKPSDDADLISDLGEGNAGTGADDETIGDGIKTSVTSYMDFDAHGGSAAAGSVGAQPDAVLDAILDVDLGGMGEADDTQAPAGLPAAEDCPDSRGTADSGTTATLRANAEDMETPADPVTGMMDLSGPADPDLIDWDDDVATGNDEDGASLNVLKRELPADSDGEDGNDVKRRRS
ncbi:conserved glutamic acid-rich protein [Ophiocordyceps camponoti-floridani]|uniref:Conserved glutamic acid-rich protein n=1 Tax=Ophiocordyceps camponoti-floridani TaxID=2030778 RepID=A0A8H4Q990_9HYPO|nr:conserved glutamic acid-rich protein [Ophiocordyceps camponoti-floridani]